MVCLGDREGEIAIWHLDVEQLLKVAAGPVTRYTNAKVVLIGESGVGKTSLGMALMRMSFAPQESTHGRTVWTLQDATVPLGPLLSEHREVLLWDMAGQQGYRVVHQLHLDDAAVALLVFDNLDETGSFGEIHYWERALRQARALQGAAARPQKRFLVAARVDRGGAGVSRERIDRLCRDLDLDGFFLTSAREAIGIDGLRQAILDGIAWEQMLKVTSTETFQRIKHFLITEKEEGRVLATADDLYRAFLRGDAGTPEAKRNEFDICIGRVAGGGLIQQFAWGDYVLLQPELLDAYASALVIAARDEPDGLGCILMEDALAGRFLIPSDLRARIKPEIQQILLIAMVRELLYRDLALLQRADGGEFLVFPAQTQREKPEFPDPRGQAVRYDFEGPVINLYATLGVRLARSTVFGTPEIYRNAIQFATSTGDTCGLLLHNKGEGDASLTLFFGDETPVAVRVVFEGFVADHLKGALNLRREPIFRCTGCGLTTISPEAAQQIRAQGKTSTICNVCGTEIPLVENRERMQGPSPISVAEVGAKADRARDRQAWVTVRRATNNYDVFFSYNTADCEAVYAIANLLIDNGVLPWLYEWDEERGRRFMPAIKKAIETCRAGAILAGDHDIGKWQEEEVDALVAETKHRPAFAVIPIVLPDATKDPDFPHFAGYRGWVDFRRADLDPLMELIRAITGLWPFMPRE